jgi:hypothetical protein
VSTTATTGSTPSTSTTQTATPNVVPTPPHFAAPPRRKTAKIFGKGHKPGSHAPINERGVPIYLRDNANVDRSKAVKNKPEPNKVKFHLKNKNGNYAQHEFARAAENKWDDGKWIGDLNKFRGQVFRRSFKYDPAYPKGTTRVNWSMAESEFLEAQVKKYAYKTGRSLTKKEWGKIARAHNKRFVGKDIKAGERLMSGSLAKSNHKITTRTATAIKAQFDKNQELKEAVGEEIAKFQSDGEESNAPAVTDDDPRDIDGDIDDVDDPESSESDSEIESGKKKNKKKKKYGGEIEHHLEDDDDSDHEGQRGASNTTGGLLLEVY